MRIKVEVCVGSVAEGDVARSFDVDGVEACTWLAVGGVTPGLGMVRLLAGAGHGSVRALVRAAPGEFVYDDAALRTMKEDVRVFAEDGSAHGIVAGVLNAAGRPDLASFDGVIEGAGDLEVTFHRAIDRSRDIEQAFASLCERGVRRVLSSGGSSLARDGTAKLAWMVRHAPGGTVVCAAGGITPFNVVEVVERTGVSEVHFAAQRIVPSLTPSVMLSSTGNVQEYQLLPDPAKIEGVLEALVKAGFR